MSVLKRLCSVDLSPMEEKIEAAVAHAAPMGCARLELESLRAQGVEGDVGNAKEDVRGEHGTLILPIRVPRESVASPAVARLRVRVMVSSM